MVEEPCLKIIHSSYDESQKQPPTEASPLLDNQATIFHELSIQPSDSLSLPSAKMCSCAVICILLTELCERLTFYGIFGNLVLFATKEDQLNLTSSGASVLSSIFVGTCYIFPLLGSWYADSVVGKFSAIFYGCIVYSVGTILIPLGSFDSTVSWGGQFLTTDKTFKQVTYICGLFLVVLGTGGIKSNVSPFGAEQVSARGPKAIQTFFIWFYWFINIGALLALTFVVYVQQFKSYFYGYLIPACTMFITTVLFFAGKNTYITRLPTGSVLLATLKIVKEALVKSRRLKLSDVRASHWLDRAKTSFGGSYSNLEVEDVKKIYRLVPIFATLILYWTIYTQITTSTFLQGNYMNIDLTSNFQIPVASLSVINFMGVLVLCPLMDKIFYPLLAKCNIHLSKLQRIGIGMVMITASMVCAGVLELYRVDDCCMVQNRDINGTLPVSNLSILFQAPQYLFTGMSEVFTTISGLELAYTEAPKSLQGLVMGICLLTTALGTYVGGALLLIVNAISGAGDKSSEWYPDKDHMNNGKLAYYFFLLAGLMIPNFILYIFVARNFKNSKMETSDQNVTEIRVITISSLSKSSDEQNSQGDIPSG